MPTQPTPASGLNEQHEPIFKGVWIPAEVWTAELTLFQKLLWATISSLSRPSQPCYASNAWLGERMNVSPSHIAKELSLMRDRGYIKDCGFNGRDRLILAIFPDEPIQTDFTPGETLPLLPSKPCLYSRVKSAFTPKETPPPSPILSRDISREQSTQSTPAEREMEKKHLQSQLEKLYQAYPKHVAKPIALRAIAKALQKTSFAELSLKVQQYAQSRQGQDPQYTPMPATWFNQERWKDDPQTWSNVASATRPAGATSISPALRLRLLKERLDALDSELSVPFYAQAGWTEAQRSAAYQKERQPKIDERKLLQQEYQQLSSQMTTPA